MALVENGKNCLISFILGLSVILVHILIFNFIKPVNDLTTYFLETAVITSSSIANVVVLWLFRNRSDFQVTVRGCFLGLVFGTGIILSHSSSAYRLLGWYLCVLSFFHWSEYFATAVTNPQHLSISSYILDHSTEYHIACAASFVEFTLECFFFPGFKEPGYISFAGLVVVISGEVLRKLAMWQASSNFNHYIRHVRETGHNLVTDGLYAYARHPSYVGWFYWSVATQIMLMNPICSILYTLASWKFFHVRITEEERTLIGFFGEEYISYQRRVGTGLPFIVGYRLSDDDKDL